MNRMLVHWITTRFGNGAVSLHENILRGVIYLEGIKISARNINNIRYVDDADVVADSEEKIDHTMNILAEYSLYSLYELKLKACKQIKYN